jgi:bifunctional non-homologous end joining protein LigD
LLFTPLNPMVAAWGDEPFDDEAYLFEPKWDGARILLHKQGRRLEAYTRSGMVVTPKFPELHEAADRIKQHTAILDCEGICMRENKPVFDDFMYRLRLSRSDRIKQARSTHPAAWVVFDVLMTADREHLREPLVDRKQRLEDMLDPGSVIINTLYLENHGKALFSITERKAMEGIVAKRKTSPYLLNTHSSDWLKFKHARTIDAVIVGFRDEPFQLMVGLQFRTVKNKPVGIVHSGFTPDDREWFMARTKTLITGKEGAAWRVKPLLCCRIQYKDRSDTHQLRHTSFVQFLPEKQPEECIWSS